MKKFNIRKVLDGLTAVSSPSPSPQLGAKENELIPETLQSEHFQLCKVGKLSSECVTSPNVAFSLITQVLFPNAPLFNTLSTDL